MIQARPAAVVHLVTPAPFGGLETVVQCLTTGLARRGVDVLLGVVVQRPEEAERFLQPFAGTSVRTQLIESRGRVYVSEWRDIVRLLRSANAGILHTHGYRSDVVGVMAARYAGVPAVTTVHGFTGGDVKNRFYQWVQRRSFRAFSAVVAVSRAMLEDLQRHGIRADRMHVIRNAWPAGRNAALDRLEARSQLGLPLDRQVIGWVGRLSREKGLDVLLEAVGRLDDPSPLVCVVGDGPLRRALVRQANNLGIEARVYWAGAVPAASAVFRAFDIFVLSSRREGTPMVLFEAMDAEVPTIASAVGGVSDVLGGDGLLVPADSPDRLAAAIRGVLTQSSLAAERAKGARARLHREFGEDQWLDQYQRLYAEITERR